MRDFDETILERLRQRRRATMQRPFGTHIAERNGAAEGGSTGRRREPTGRTEQMNFRMTAAIKQEFEAEVKRRGVLSAVLFEEMLAAYREKTRTGA